MMAEYHSPKHPFKRFPGILLAFPQQVDEVKVRIGAFGPNFCGRQPFAAFSEEVFLYDAFAGHLDKDKIYLPQIAQILRRFFSLV